MTAGFQPSLLDAADAAGLRELGGSVRRTELAGGAWLDLRPGWVSGADALFERLLETVPWRAERRQMYDNVVDVPRLLSYYDADQARPDPVLDQAMLALDAYYGPELGEPLSTVGLCLYRDGRDSVAWHGDTSGRQVPRDDRGDRLARQSARAGPAPARRRTRAALSDGARRSAGHGRHLPARLAARRTQDGPGGRAADQRAVPPARNPLRLPLCRAPGGPAVQIPAGPAVQVPAAGRLAVSPRRGTA